MEEVQKKELHISPPDIIVKAGVVVLGSLALFLIILAVSSLKEYRFIGSGISATNTITVSGDGDVFAVPDTAEFTVTVQEQAKDVKSAQDAATKKNNDIVAYLKTQGIADKDIQTTDYSVNPEYDYVAANCAPGIYCPGGKQVLRDFQVSQTLSIKVRDTTKSGDILSGVGTRGASSVSGLTFTVDDEDALKAAAQDKAIAAAKTKADALAKSLGVSIVRVVGFNENGGGYPVMYAAKSMAMDSAGAVAPEASPTIPVGQNKITSSVTVTYEIR